MPLPHHPHRCLRCGSDRIRHSRSRTAWQRLVRGWTSFDRYACGNCGHRGWRYGRLRRNPRTSAHGGTLLPRAGTGRRPTERRDLRVRRARRNRQLSAILLATALGLGMAASLQRCAAQPVLQPPE